MNKSDLNTVVLAEKLYLYEGMTFADIAAKTGKSEKTIRNWKNKYGWESKKAEYLKSIRNLPQQMYEDYTLLMQSIREDIAKGEEVSAARYNLALKLFDRIPQAAEVEKSARGAEETKKINPADATKAVREAFGLTE